MIQTASQQAIAVVGHYVVFVIDFMAARGVSAEAVLANTGLTETDLRHRPDQPIALATALTLIHNVHTRDSSPTLSLEFGLSLDISKHGFLGYAFQASATLGDALRLAHEFAQTRSPILSFRFHEAGENACIRIDDHGAFGHLYAHIVETLLACLFNIGTKLLGALELDHVKVELAIEEQPHHRLLKQLGGGNLHFDCQHTAVHFPSNWLATCLPQPDPQLVALAAARCRDELNQAQHYAAQQAHPEDEFIAKVVSLLKQEMATSNAQAIIADALHITPRTLHRRLAHHGLQFKTVLDELRHAAALERLRLRRDSLADISVALGYSDQANFVRAFKRWTGQTPSQFVSQLRGT